MESFDIVAIQEDAKALEAYLASMKTSVLRMASHILNKKIDASDEASAIAFYALYEAIKRYEPSRGVFEHFAYQVIKSRLYDEGRKQKRIYHKETLIGDASDEQIQHFFNQEALSTYALLSSRDKMQLEVQKLSKELSAYHITYDVLLNKRPKTHKTNEMIFSLITCISDNPSLYERMLSSHTLPIQAFGHCSAFNRKSIERHRAYIVARLIIWFGDYPLIKKNINWRSK